MKIDTEKFLAMTAILAGTTLAVACASDSEGGDKNGGSSDSGAGGSSDGDGGKGSGGKGGGSATGGKGSGGTASGGKGGGGMASGGGGGTDGGSDDGGPDGSAGGSGDGGDGGPVECLGDTAPPVPMEAGAPDAGGESIPPCVTFPTTLTDCGDAGVEGVAAPALAVCWNAITYLRAGVAAAVVECLTTGTLPVAPCSEEATARARACYDDAVGRACDQTVDAGANPCAAFAAGCGLSEKTCTDTLKASNDPASFVACIQSQTPVGDAGTEGFCDFSYCSNLVL